MNYSTFKQKVIAMIGDTPVKFMRSNGKHIAKCPDGVVICGNTVSKKVGVKWGSGHFAVV